MKRSVVLAARGETPASHRAGRGAPPARRDDREYREYLREEQRRRRGCIARRMQPAFHHGLLAIAVAAAAVAARAQTTYPYIAETKQNYGIIKSNLVRMAEKMPEEHYGFRPAGETRSFGEAIGHVADSQARSCSLVNGTTRAVDAAAKRSKAELVAALKGSLAICDEAFEALTDAGASQMVRLGQSTRERSKLGLLIGLTSHSNEQYGYLAVYLRIKGIVPPSSEPQ